MDKALRRRGTAARRGREREGADKSLNLFDRRKMRGTCVRPHVAVFFFFFTYESHRFHPWFHQAESWFHGGFIGVS